MKEIGTNLGGDLELLVAALFVYMAVSLPFLADLEQCGD